MCAIYCKSVDIEKKIAYAKYAKVTNSQTHTMTQYKSYRKLITYGVTWSDNFKCKTPKRLSWTATPRAQHLRPNRSEFVISAHGAVSLVAEYQL